MQYQIGTVSAQNGSNTIVGVGTLWLSSVVAGDYFIIPAAQGGDDVSYQISSITDQTHIVLSSVYGGATVSGKNYTIFTDFTPYHNLPLLSAGDIAYSNAVSMALTTIDTALHSLDVQASSLNLALYNASPLFIDDVNNRLGINTASPGYALDVAGTEKLTGDLRLSNTSNIVWRNAANNADLNLTVGPDNFLDFNAIQLVDVSSAQTLGNKSFSGTTNFVDVTATGNLTVGTNAIVTDANKNIGFSTNPNSNSSSIYRNLELGPTQSIFYQVNGATNNLQLWSNAYYNGTNPIYSLSAAASRVALAGGSIYLSTAASGTAGNTITWTDRLAIDVNGNYGFNTSTLNNSSATNYKNISVGSYSSWMYNTTSSDFYFGSGHYFDGTNWKYLIATTQTQISLTNAGFFVSTGPTGTVGNNLTLTQRLSIDSSGILTNTNAASSRTVFYNTHASAPYGQQIAFNAAAPNGTGNEFLYCTDTSVLRMSVRSNGGIANYSANNVNLSDKRIKTDITPIYSMLDKLNKIEIVNFIYKDQDINNPEQYDGPNIGVIAQQVLSVAPEFVDERGFSADDVEKHGRKLLSIYQTDLQYATIKALQELTQLVKDQAEKIKMFEAKLGM